MFETMRTVKLAGVPGRYTLTAAWLFGFTLVVQLVGTVDNHRLQLHGEAAGAVLDRLKTEGDGYAAAVLDALEARKKGKRRLPYTSAGIHRLACFRCGCKGARFQWKICADHSYRPLCASCDVALNKLVGEFLGLPNDFGTAYERSVVNDV